MSPNRYCAADKAHCSAAGGKGAQVQAIGCSRGGRNAKLHAITDKRGRPLAFLLTPDRIADWITNHTRDAHGSG